MGMTGGKQAGGKQAGGSAELRIALLGKTGVGKSSTANNILRKKPFNTSCHAKSKTNKCEAKTETVDGRSITVVDTPGHFSTECTDEKLKPEIAECIIECSPGPHAFLILLPIRRHTEEEKKAVEEIPEMFGEEALKYAIVLFTHGNELEDDMTIQQFVDDNDHLKTLVQKCGSRLHVIDNKYWNNPTEGHGDETRNAKEIQKLLNTIDQMVEQNGGKHYTNEMLEAVAQAIEEEVVNVREETGGKSSESTVNKRAREKVKRFLIQAAGVSTGVLMGALLGAVACVGVVAVLLVGLTVQMCMAGGGAAAAVVAGAEGVVAVSAATGIGLGAAAGAAAGVIAGAGACAGVIAGGITGARAAKKAQSPREAAEKAFHDVTEPVVNYVKNKIEETMPEGCKKAG